MTTTSRGYPHPDDRLPHSTINTEHYRSLYESFHIEPELSHAEAKTARRVKDTLQGLGGLTIHEGIGGHGLVGVCRNGDGPTVLLRADMDGLPLKENTGLKYQSRVEMIDPLDGRKKPVMHACGHDMHMTCLLAATEVLVKQWHSKWRGTLLVLFQPAEERGTGAKMMVEDGLYDRVPIPDILLGQHVMANLPAGQIGLKSDIIMASADSMRCNLVGRGSHASQPHRSVDAGLLAANTIVALQQIVSREMPPSETVVVTAVPLSAGVAENIIPAEIEIGVDVRTLNPVARDRVLQSIHRIIRAQSSMAGLETEPVIRPTRTFPVTNNDRTSTKVLQKAFEATFGDKFESETKASTIAEDFPNLAQGKPYVFWLLGCGDGETYNLSEYPDERPPVPMNHTAEFTPVVVPTLTTGVDALVMAALEFLHS